MSLAVAAALLMAVNGASPNLAATEATNVVVGLLLPPEEAEAASLRSGVQLGIEHANRAATSSVSLVVRGRTGQWGADGVEAARMVLDDGAKGLIAPPSGAATHLALQVAGRTAVPVISLCADSSVSRTGVPWMLRIAPTTIEEARFLLGRLLANPSDPPQWAAAVPDGRAGREVSRDLSRAAVEAQRGLGRIWVVSSALTNLELVTAQVLAEQPKGLLIWLDPVPAGKLTRSLREAGFAGRLAGPSRCNSPAFLAAATSEAEGFLVPAIALDKPGEARLLSFQTAFRQRFGTEADTTAAESYDAASLLIHILQKNDLQSLPRAFPLDFSLPGASGVLSFDNEGNRKVSLRLLIARQGRFVPPENPQK